MENENTRERWKIETREGEIWERSIEKERLR